MSISACLESGGVGVVVGGGGVGYVIHERVEAQSM